MSISERVSYLKGLAERMKIKIYSYKIIYELLDEIERVIKGMKEPKYEEVYNGKAEVIAVFKLSNSGIVAGSRVLDGKILRGEKCKIYRNNEVVSTSEIKSLKIVKDDVKEVKAGFECGLVFDGFDQMQELDIVEAYIMVEVPR